MSEATTQQSASIAKLLPALIRARGEYPALLKDSENPHFKSRYADLAAVLEACDKPLGKHDLAILQVPVWDAGSLVLQTTLVHTSGEWIRSTYPVGADVNRPQVTGASMTYARRYTYMAMAGIAPEDDDGEAASGRGGAQAATQPRPNPVAERNRQSHEGRTNGIGRAPAQAPAGWGGGLAAAPAAPVNGNGHPANGTNGHAKPRVDSPLVLFAAQLKQTEATHRNGDGLVAHMEEWGQEQGLAQNIRHWPELRLTDAQEEARNYLKGLLADPDGPDDDNGYDN